MHWHIGHDMSNGAADRCQQCHALYTLVGHVHRCIPRPAPPPPKRKPKQKPKAKRNLGYPIQVNQDVAVMAANAKSIAFGDFSFYTIRDVMDVTIFRFTDSAYTKLGQVGFLAWLRSGGNFIDVGGSVKLFVNAAS